MNFFTSDATSFSTKPAAVSPHLTRVETHLERNGDLKGVQVDHRISAKTESVFYHRTNRVQYDLGAFFTQEILVAQTRSKRILDIGCGGGAFVSSLQKTAPAVGLDLFLTAEQKNHPAFVGGDAYRLPFKIQSFDFVFSAWSVFSYEPLSRLDYLLSELNRVMVLGASAYLTPIAEPGRLAKLKLSAQRFGFQAAVDLKSQTVRLIKNR